MSETNSSDKPTQAEIRAYEAQVQEMLDAGKGGVAELPGWSRCEVMPTGNGWSHMTVAYYRKPEATKRKER